MHQAGDYITIEFAEPVLGATLSFIPIKPDEVIVAGGLLAIADQVEVYSVTPAELYLVSEGIPVTLRDHEFILTFLSAKGTEPLVEAVEMNVVNTESVILTFDDGTTATVSRFNPLPTSVVC